MNSYKKNLADGNWFQINVAGPWLTRTRSDCYITPTSTDTNPKYKGPRLYKGTDEIILPDFRWDNPTTKDSGWVDAKMKKCPFSIKGRWGEKFYSIDPKKYNEYQKLCRVFHYMSFEILLGCQETGLLYNFDFTKCQPVMHFFDNQFVRGGRNETPCYSTATMTVVGRWDSHQVPK